MRISVEGTTQDFNVCTFFREVSCINDHLGGCSPLIQIVVIHNGWCNLLTILMAVAALSKGDFITGCKQNHAVHYVVSSWIFGGNNSDSKACTCFKGLDFYCWPFGTFTVEVDDFSSIC